MQFQNDTEHKQFLLKSEIYDKGYDCQLFQDYMDEVKSNGGQDIEIWTLDELQQAIIKFQDSHQLVMQNIELDTDFQENYWKEEEAQKIQNNDNLVVKQQEEIVTKPIIDTDRIYHKTMICQTQEQKIIMTPTNITINIKYYDRVPGGIFTSAYYIYNVVTEPLGWEVMRRYNDFAWLRDVLTKLYPGKNIPPMPSKSVFKNQYDLYLTKRMKFLERFLQTILNSDLLRNDKWFVAFISVKEEKDFKHIQKLSENLQRIQKLEQLTTLNGTIDLDINDNLNEYNKESNQLILAMEQQYKKLRKDSKQLLLDFDQTSNTIFNMGETCSQLYQLTNKFNQSISKDKCPQLDVLFIAMNNMLVQWGNNLTIQIKVIQDDLCNYFKFQDHQLNSLKDFLKSREQSHYEYEKYKQRLDQKKTKLFQTQDYSRWEVPAQQIKSLQTSELISNSEVCLALMLPKETSIQEDLKNVFAYYNNQAHIEINQHFQNTVSQFVTHFGNFCNQQKHMLAEQKQSWDESIMNLTSLHVNPQIKIQKH